METHYPIKTPYAIVEMSDDQLHMSMMMRQLMSAVDRIIRTALVEHRHRSRALTALEDTSRSILDAIAHDGINAVEYGDEGEIISSPWQIINELEELSRDWTGPIYDRSTETPVTVD